MVLCKTRKLVFIHIPKTGGTTVEVALKLYGSQYYGVQGGRAMQHYDWRDYQRILGDECHGYYSFTVCRDPVDKLLSEYYWCKISRVGHRGGQTIDEFIEYCAAVVESGAYRTTVYHDHFMPQHLFIFDGDVQMVDRIYKFERFDEVESYLKSLGCTTSVQNRNPVRDRTVQLTPEQTRRVYEIYRRDYELFGYPPP